MSDSLTGQRVSATYGRILQIANANDGADGTLRAVMDGKGDATPLYLSTAYVGIGVASANYWTMSGAAAVGSTSVAEVRMDMAGSNTHVGMIFAAKGDGWFRARRLVAQATSLTPTNGALPAIQMGIVNSLTGTITSGVATAFFWQIAADTASASGATGENLYYMNGLNTFGGAGMTGGRIGLNVSHSFGGGNSSNTSGSQYFHTGIQSQTVASFRDGGIPNDSSGQLFAFFGSSELRPGGKYWNEVKGMELNTSIDRFGSATRKYGLTITVATTDAEEAVVEEAYIVIGGKKANATSSIGMRSGIIVGGTAGFWGIPASGSIFEAAATTVTTGTPPAMTAAYGIDWSLVTFGGGFLRAANFAVDGSGNSGSNAVASGMTLQTLNGITAKTAGVASYTVLDGGMFTAIPTFTVAASPGGGTTATGTVATMGMLHIREIYAAGSGYAVNDLLTPNPPTFVADISGTVMTVTSAACVLKAGVVFSGSGVTVGTTIVSFGTGTGGTGTYNVSVSQTVSSTTMTFAVGSAAQIRVTEVNGSGAILAATIERVLEVKQIGSYSALPNSPFAVTGGTGSAAEFRAGYTILTCALGTAGTLYPEFPAPIVTVSGTALIRKARIMPVMTASATPLLLANNYAHYLSLTGAANTGVFDTSAPVLQAAGTGSNIDAKVLGKGTGRFNTTKEYIGVTSDRAGANEGSTVVWKARPTYVANAGYPTWRSGTAAAGTWGVDTESGAFNTIAIDRDSVDATSSGGPGLLSALFVTHAMNAGATGGRVAVSGFLNIGEAITAGTGAGSFLLASAFFSQASASAGGTAGAGNAKGNLFGTNVSARLLNGAGLYYNSVIGGEINYGTPTGTAAVYKVGLQIVQWGDDAVAGLAGTDTALSIISQTSGTVIGLDTGITFGHSLGWWAIKPTGTLIGTTVSNTPAGPAYAAANGVDFSGVTFSTSAFKSTGFTVDGSGNTTANSFIVGSSGPTWTKGTGAPGTTTPRGSIYSRTDGGVGTTLYVSQGGGTWNAIAGV